MNPVSITNTLNLLREFHNFIYSILSQNFKTFLDATLYLRQISSPIHFPESCYNNYHSELGFLIACLSHLQQRDIDCEHGH